MKKMISVLLMGMLFSFAAAGEIGTKLRAGIPFAFEAGGQTMPPGSYQFTAGDDMSNRVVIENRQTRKQVVLQALPLSRRSRAARTTMREQLIFDRSGVMPRLTTGWGVGITDGLRIAAARGVLPEGNHSKSAIEQIAVVTRSR